MARKIVSAVQMIFSFEKIIISGIETMVWVKNTMFPASETIVRAAKKMVMDARQLSNQLPRITAVLFACFCPVKQNIVGQKNIRS